MNADGTNVVRLNDNAVFDGGPNFSPDGQKTLFIRSLGPGQGQELFSMNADGTNEMQVTKPPWLQHPCKVGRAEDPIAP
jgi:Tol biopolymer transport system component